MDRWSALTGTVSNAGDGSSKFNSAHRSISMTAQPRLHEMTPTEVHDALRERSIVLIDVREPQEYVTERIHGALLFPLSSFDPGALPVGGRSVVLHCGSGKRSAMAVAKCIGAGVPVTAHLKGGIMAWKHARYPTITLDPNTGEVVDRK
jgi:rhodanese-related sulfurtransferase